LSAKADYGADFPLERTKLDISIPINARGHNTPRRAAMLSNGEGKSTRSAPAAAG